MKKKIIFSMLFFLSIIFFWQIFESKFSQVQIKKNQTAIEAFIPTPLTIVSTFKNHGNQIFIETAYTLKRALLGFLIGTSMGIILAVLFMVFPIIRNLIFPVSFTINSFPIVGFAPIVILAFGQGSWLSIVFISTLICYFPTLISMDTAFKETDKDLLDLMHVWNATPLQTFLKLRLPLALPYLFLSMKLAIPASIIGATMGEWLGTRNGIGQLITVALYQLKPGLLYASLITIALVSVVLIFLVSTVQSMIFAWKKNE